MYIQLIIQLSILDLNYYFYNFFQLKEFQYSLIYLRWLNKFFALVFGAYKNQMVKKIKLVEQLMQDTLKFKIKLDLIRKIYLYNKDI